MGTTGILGGTGPHGLGLGVRLGAAGERLLVGSRRLDRALAAAERIRAAVPDADVVGLINHDVLARTERVALCVPFDALEGFLAGERERLADKLIVDAVVPLQFVGGQAEVATVPGAGSAGEYLQAALPDARVVSAFKNVPASVLQDFDTPLDADVLVCGRDDAAREEVSALVRRIPGLRPVDAGGIANARVLEAITALLVNLNRRHRAHTSIRITGLP